MSSETQEAKKKSYIIVFGNEKGGSGKTTTCVHLAVNLLRLGFRVASIDLDTYQQSLSRYIENRQKTSINEGIPLSLPEHFKIAASDSPTRRSSNGGAENGNSININHMAPEEQEHSFIELIESLTNYDFVIIDTPGSRTALSKLAHSFADILITPFSDSPLDVDLLGQMNPEKMEMLAPGVYSAMVFEQMMKKVARENRKIDWIVVRNRLSTLDSTNKKNVESSIVQIAKKLGFRIAPGFGDRVIFKELFLHGLTLFDASVSSKVKISPSVLVARQEMREFMKALKLKEIIDLLDNKNSA